MLCEKALKWNKTFANINIWNIYYIGAAFAFNLFIVYWGLVISFWILKNEHVVFCKRCFFWSALLVGFTEEIFICGEVGACVWKHVTNVSIGAPKRSQEMRGKLSKVASLEHILFLKDTSPGFLRTTKARPFSGFVFISHVQKLWITI